MADDKEDDKVDNDKRKIDEKNDMEVDSNNKEVNETRKAEENDQEKTQEERETTQGLQQTIVKGIDLSGATIIRKYLRFMI